MAVLPTDQAIIRFDANEDLINTWVNNTGTYTPNSGLPAVTTIPSFMIQQQNALNLLAGRNYRGAWQPNTAYAVWDLVSEGGTWYQCVTAHTSGTTFVQTNWLVAQGVTSGQLASTGGAALVGTSGGQSLQSLLTNNLEILSASIGALRQLQSVGCTNSFVSSYYGDGKLGGGSFQVNASDTTSGCLFTGSISGNILTVTSVTNGTIVQGHSVNSPSLPHNIYVTSFGTGTGGAGTYNLSESATVSSSVMTTDNGGNPIVAFDGARWYRKNYSEVFATDFGAEAGTVASITANTLSIQSAINYCQAITTSTVNTDFTGVTLFFPQGVYQTNSQLNIVGSFGINGFTMQGMNATIAFTQNGNCLYFSSVGSVTTAPEYRMNCYVDGLNMIGLGGVANTSAVGVKIYNSARVVLRNLSIMGSNIGVYGLGALLCDFENCNINNNVNAYNFYDTTMFAPNMLNFRGGSIRENTVAFYAQNFPNGEMNFDGVHIEGNNTTGTIGDGTQIFKIVNGGSTLLSGCHFEANNGTDGIYYSGTTLQIDGGQVIHTCTNVLNIALGTVILNGGRVTNGTATNNTYLSSGVSFAVINGCATAVTGYPQNAVWNNTAGISIGTGSASPASAAYNAYLPINNKATLFQSDVIVQQFNNTAGTRITYFQSLNASNFAFCQVQNYGWEFDSNNAAAFYIARGGTSNKSIEPGADNTWSNGSAALRWSQIYAGNGTINTSDGREKTEVADIDPAALRAWARLGKHKQFKFIDAVNKKGALNARVHVGRIAQDIMEAFKAEGLDPFKYGVLCYDKWGATPALPEITETDANGNKVVVRPAREAMPAGDRYGVRMDQAAVFDAALMESRIAAIEESLKK